MAASCECPAHQNHSILSPRTFGAVRWPIPAKTWRCGFVCLCVTCPGVHVLSLLAAGAPCVVQASGIGGMVVGLATAFKPNWAPWSAPLYAALKGAVLGSLSIQACPWDGSICSTGPGCCGNMLYGAVTTGIAWVRC